MRQNGGFFMSTGNQEYIRDMNRALVLEAIANHPPLSRADLAKMLVDDYRNGINPFQEGV